MERQITISLDEYNKLIDMHTKREELPEKIEVKKFTSKWWKWLKRASCSLLHYNKNAEQQKLIKRCINETASTIRENLINGYWRGDLSEYFKDGNFDVTLRSYKDVSYDNVMPNMPRYKVGDKIVQFHLETSGNIMLIETDELNKTERGDNGYGSSDKK